MVYYTTLAVSLITALMVGLGLFVFLMTKFDRAKKKIGSEIAELRRMEGLLRKEQFI